jgi:phosphate transport system substrate-binding protein
MLRTKLFHVLSAIAVGALLLSACATPTPQVIVQTQIVPQVQTQIVPQVQTQVVTVKETQVVTVKETQVVAATAVPATPKPTALPAGSVQINGAGATFPLPVYTAWTYAYQFIDPAVVLNYQGIGSGGGKKGIIDNTIDFAGTDSVLKDEEYAKGGDLQMYPILAGAVVPVYNIWLDDKTQFTKTLTLDRATLVGIFLGEIKKWNDPAIIALNPEAKLPAANISVVHRSDGSGTTEIFTNALAAFAPDKWVTKDGKPNAGSAIEWAVDKAGSGIGGKGNQGVAAAVLTTKNSIGYVELSYAISNSMAYPMLINKAGKAVKADAKSLAAAMNDFAGGFNDKLTAKIVDGAGEGSWPIAGYTYLILHTTSMKDCVKAQKLMDYIKWSLTDAAAAQGASKLGYAVLPSEVQKTVLAKLGEVTCGGQPLK